MIPPGFTGGPAPLSPPELLKRAKAPSISGVSAASILSPPSVATAFQATKPGAVLEAAVAREAAAHAGQTLSFKQTVGAIREQLKDPKTMKVFKGLAMQYGPDLAMPALFSVPVVGWGAGCAAMPFAWWFGRRGEKIVETEKAHLTKENPVRYALKIQQHWNDRPEGLTDKLAKNYNRLVEKLFHKEGGTTEALRRTLRMTPGKWTYRQLDRLVHAREAFLRCKWLSLPLKPLDWAYRYIPVLPRFLKMVALLPKFGLIGLFYLLGIRPPVK